jgi:hypothetical protein
VTVDQHHRSDSPPAAGDQQAGIATASARSFTWIYAVILVLALVVLGVGIYRVAAGQPDWNLLSAGCISLIAVAVTWPLALTLSAHRAAAAREREELVQRLAERLDQMSILMNVMSDQQLLSDRAKQVAYRDKDRDAIRRAISEEMGRGDYDASFALADAMEVNFGRGEADRLRDEIRARKTEAVRKQVADVVAVIDRHTRNEQWNAAMREAERLMQVFPENETVRNLPAEIENRRQSHKRQLLNSWNEAVQRHDIDGSIEILKNLDLYLTPAEAEGMQETARGVFKERLNNLCKHFATAVTDHKWTDAIRIGETISREYPNTRSAQEVREKMDLLRQRASEPAGSPAAHTPVAATHGPAAATAGASS